jgi:hypothetical protein
MPILSAVVDQYDRRWSKFYASRQHYVRSTDNDVDELLKKHQAAKIFHFDGSRTVTPGNMTRNILAEGQQVIMNSKYLEGYARDRQTQYGMTNTLELYEANGVTVKDAVLKLRHAYNPKAAYEEPGPPAEQAETNEIQSHVTPSPKTDTSNNVLDNPHSPIEGMTHLRNNIDSNN